VRGGGEINDKDIMNFPHLKYFHIRLKYRPACPNNYDIAQIPRQSPGLTPGSGKTVALILHVAHRTHCQRSVCGKPR